MKKQNPEQKDYIEAYWRCSAADAALAC